MQATEENPEFNYIKIAFVLLLVLIAVLVLTGCTPSLEKALEVATETEQRAKTAQYTIHGKYPNVTAAFSATVYPVSESTDTETTVEQGNVQQFKEQASRAEAKADSLLEALNSLPVKPECKDEAQDRDKVIYALQSQLKGLNNQAQYLKADKETVVQRITKESTAKVDAMQYTVDTLQARVIVEREAKDRALAEAEKVKTERNKLLWILGSIVLLIVVAVILKLKG